MDTLQFVPIMVVGFAASLGLTPLSRQIAMRLGVVDKPNQRKIHQTPKPLMGGFAIYAAFMLAMVLFSPPQYVVEIAAVLSGATFLALVGLVDDRYELGIKVKLVAELAAAGVAIAAGIHVNLFHIVWLDYPITIIWFLTLMNAVNFQDNMDGLAAGMSAIASAFFLLIAYQQGLTLVSSLAAGLLGSSVGFLIYNFNPASTFMGDMGSLVIGFLLATLGIKLEFVDRPFSSLTWIVPVLLLAEPLFDICLVVVTRISEGRSPGQAGKDHTSHRLMSLGLSQRWTLLALYGACIAFGALGLWVSTSRQAQALRIETAALVLLAALFVGMVIVRRRYQLKK